MMKIGHWNISGKAEKPQEMRSPYPQVRRPTHRILPLPARLWAKHLSQKNGCGTKIGAAAYFFRRK